MLVAINVAVDMLGREIFQKEILNNYIFRKEGNLGIRYLVNKCLAFVEYKAYYFFYSDSHLVLP